MALAAINICRDAPAEFIRVVSEAIYKAMVDVANVLVHDKFRVINRHGEDEIIYGCTTGIVLTAK
jgi:4-oxalocrotonate tautomerase